MKAYDGFGKSKRAQFLEHLKENEDKQTMRRVKKKQARQSVKDVLKKYIQEDDPELADEFEELYN